MAVKRISVIVNPLSGPSDPELKRLIAALDKLNAEYDIHIVSRLGDAARFAFEAASKKMDVIAVYAGDGTLMEVAKSLECREIPIAILPGGTANVLAAGLGIPRRLEEAVALIGDSKSRIFKADIGAVRQDRFLINLGVGLTAEMIRHTSRDDKERFGIMAYVISAIKALTKHKNVHFKITLDDRVIETEGVTCMIANGGDTGLLDIRLAHDIQMNDGIFDVVLLKSADIISLLPAVTDLLFSTEKTVEKALQHYRARNILIETDQPLPVSADGEIITNTPVEIQMIPEAVEFITPKDRKRFRNLLRPLRRRIRLQ